MVAVHQPDGFGLGATLQHVRSALERQGLNQDHLVAVRQHRAVGILHDAGFFRFSRALPFVTAGRAFQALRMFQDFGGFAHRTGGLAHEANTLTEKPLPAQPLKTGPSFDPSAQVEAGT